MSLTAKENKEILDELDSCNRPLYFFHDDTDGLCSFLLFYRYKKEGKGICVKAQPILNDRFQKIVEDYVPDKIFVLDIPNLDQDFVDTVVKELKIPIIWIDHHTPQKISGVKYYNPRKKDIDNNIPAAKLCYDVVVQDPERKKDLWIAAVGFIGDWTIQPGLDELAKQYPGLVSPRIKRPEKALFDTKISEVIRIMNFILKGNTRGVMKCVKVLTRIESPYELLEPTTPPAKFVIRRYNVVNKIYQDMLSDALDKFRKEKSKLLVYVYESGQLSMSGDLSNELLYNFPKNVMIIGRIKNGEVKMSLRSGIKTKKIPPILKKALIGVEGYGGGHEYACGSCVKEKDFDKFLASIKEQVDAK
ncbi:DHH family phosphoesterase [Candidatus Woesearchaeota archaeon]|nr:DHH family phosphoesterase [Candidatus Woesearchaeota archaeon]